MGAAPVGRPAAGAVDLQLGLGLDGGDLIHYRSQRVPVSRVVAAAAPGESG